MLIRLFSSNSPPTVVIFPLLVTCLWLYAFIFPSQVSVDHAMPFYEVLLFPLQGFPLLCSFIGFILVIGNGFIYNYLINEHEFLPKRTYLPGLFYGILMSSSTSLLKCHPILFANIFITLALHNLLLTYRKDKAFSQVFDASLFLAIASLFYFPASMLYPALLISLIVLRPFIWREWVISVIGFILPYLFTATYYYWFDKSEYLWVNKAFYPIIYGDIDFKFLLQGNLVLLLMLTFLFLALAKIGLSVTSRKLKTQKAYTILVWMLGFSFLSVFLAGEISMYSLSILSVFSAVLFANYFLSIKRIWISQLLFTLLLGTIIFMIWKDKFF